MKFFTVSEYYWVLAGQNLSTTLRLFWRPYWPLASFANRNRSTSSLIPQRSCFLCVWWWWWWGRRKSFHLVRILPAGWDRDGFVCRPPFLLCTYPPPAPLPHPPHSYSTNHTLIPFLPPVFLTAPSCPLPHLAPKCKQARTQLPVSFASVQTFSGNDYERAKHFSKYQERFKLALPLPLSNSQI